MFSEVLVYLLFQIFSAPWYSKVLNNNIVEIYVSNRDFMRKSLISRVPILNSRNDKKGKHYFTTRETSNQCDSSRNFCCIDKVFHSLNKFKNIYDEHLEDETGE